MEITEVRIKLMEDAGERLQAFCSVTFDDAFVVRDLKIIDGAKGAFVAMPSRKLTDRCPKCSCKNHLRSNFCNQCGTRLGENRAITDDDGRAKLHADIAHPINTACREMIQKQVIEAYEAELDHSQQPGYTSTYEDYDLDDYTLVEIGSDASDEGPVKSDSPDAEVINRLEPEDETKRQPHLHRTDRATQSQNSNASTDGNRNEFGAGIL